MSDDVIIYADAESFPEVYRALEAVAERAKDIRFTADGPLARGLIVPQDLYERYVSLQSSSPEEPKKRGPGRPRKNTAPESGITP